MHRQPSTYEYYSVYAPTAEDALTIVKQRHKAPLDEILGSKVVHPPNIHQRTVRAIHPEGDPTWPSVKGNYVQS